MKFKNKFVYIKQSPYICIVKIKKIMTNTTNNIKGQRVELFHCGIREMGIVTGETEDKKKYIVEPDCPLVTTKEWSKTMCELK